MVVSSVWSLIQNWVLWLCSSEQVPPLLLQVPKASNLRVLSLPYPLPLKTGLHISSAGPELPEHNYTVSTSQVLVLTVCSSLFCFVCVRLGFELCALYMHVRQILFRLKTTPVPKSKMPTFSEQAVLSSVDFSTVFSGSGDVRQGTLRRWKCTLENSFHAYSHLAL